MVTVVTLPPSKKEYITFHAIKQGLLLVSITSASRFLRRSRFVQSHIAIVFTRIELRYAILWFPITAISIGHFDAKRFDFSKEGAGMNAKRFGGGMVDFVMGIAKRPVERAQNVFVQ